MDKITDNFIDFDGLEILERRVTSLNKYQKFDYKYYVSLLTIPPDSSLEYVIRTIKDYLSGPHPIGRRRVLQVGDLKFFLVEGQGYFAFSAYSLFGDKARLASDEVFATTIKAHFL
jgi:hypothetical protein